MSDLIDRQAAIDTVLEEIDKWDGWHLSILKLKVLHSVIALPSAQPDLSDYSDRLWKAAYERGKAEAQPEIIYCGECKYMMPDGRCYEFADDNIRPSVSDFCSRAERREDA